MEESIKQEGEFKMSKPKKPRNLSKTDDVVKVEIIDDSIKQEQEVPKVIIPQEVSEIVDIDKKEESTENTIQEITEEEIKSTSENIEQQVEKHIQEQINTGKPLPENIEKLVSFMEETGGTVEDYVRLNTDYSNVDENTLLREYYRNTKPHLDKEEIEFLMEDNFSYDEDLDEERDIRKKKLAFKEEVARAKKHLETVKEKYYDEIKLNSNVNPQYQEAYDFFNRYKKNEERSKTQHEQFITQTKSLFNNEFKGFEFNVGDKRFRYGVQNPDQIAEKQSDINNFVGKFLDKDGNVTDHASYHKALYAAMNSDKIAQHFYEQGKADAVKEVINNSKNPLATAPRQAPGEVFINGLKVKSISGFDSSKLRIQTKKFNN
jgi:hypothetical protein